MQPSEQSARHGSSTQWQLVTSNKNYHGKTEKNTNHYGPLKDLLNEKTTRKQAFNSQANKQTAHTQNVVAIWGLYPYAVVKSHVYHSPGMPSEAGGEVGVGQGTVGVGGRGWGGGG